MLFITLELAGELHRERHGTGPHREHPLFGAISLNGSSVTCFWLAVYLERPRQSCIWENTFHCGYIMSFIEMMYLFLVLFVVWTYFSKEKVDSLLPHCLQFPLTVAIEVLCR